MKRHHIAFLIAVVAFGFVCGPRAFAQQHQHMMMPNDVAADTASPVAQADRPAQPPAASPASAPMSSHAPTTFTLRTGIAEGRMVFIGVGGDIDRQVNPTLTVHEGETVQVNLINGEGAQHDVVIDQYAARSAIVSGKNASSTFSFVASKVASSTISAQSRGIVRPEWRVCCG
jgi:nitrite reductase (NO-forming)